MLQGRKQVLHHTKSLPKLQKPQMPTKVQSKWGYRFGVVPAQEHIVLLRIVLPLKCNIELLNFNSTKEAGA